MPNLDLITIAQAAVILDENRSRTARRVDHKEIPSVKMDGAKRPYLLHRSDVLKLAAKLAATRRAEADSADAALEAAKAGSAAS